MTREKFIEHLKEAHREGFYGACKCLLITGEMELYARLRNSYPDDERINKAFENFTEEVFQQLLNEK